MARAIGYAAFVYGYPLVESFRTCRLQTRAPGEDAATGRPLVDEVAHSPRPWTHEDRDIVTPANDLLYTTAWINLADGPRLLEVPAATSDPGRYFVLALYDAYTENFANLGPRNCAPGGETVVLVGPGAPDPDGFAAGRRVVRCPTDLVWLIARVVVGDGDDVVAARALQRRIAISPAPGTGHGRRPDGVERWVGEPIETMAALVERGEPVAAVAERFYANLCRALPEAPGRTEDQGMVAWFAKAELRPSKDFEWGNVDPLVREGLVEGLAEAVELVVSASRSRRASPWVVPTRGGRYGNDYLTRALTAYIGLGMLATDEAVYCPGHFDADGAPLVGSRRYTMRFAPDDTPPADAFWSVTLYDADRFLYGNEIGRHAIGDRTPGLRRDPDGGLTLVFSHARPQDASNWLPTPEGRFYLILRLYYPRDGVRGWRVPPLRPLPA
ncbi:MAG: DUF1254 domain-containing protein [Burkholderiaceae bacterium]